MEIRVQLCDERCIAVKNLLILSSVRFFVCQFGVLNDKKDFDSVYIQFHRCTKHYQIYLNDMKVLYLNNSLMPNEFIILGILKS